MGLRSIIFLFIFLLERTYVLFNNVLFLREVLFHKSVILSSRTGTEFRFIIEAFGRKVLLLDSRKLQCCFAKNA